MNTALRHATVATVTLAVAAALAGCEAVADRTGCTAPKDSSGNVTGEIKCQLKVGTNMQLASWSGPAQWLAGTLPDGWLAQVVSPINPSSFDALLLRLSTQGTNVPMSATSGNFTVTLYERGTPVASNVFGWIKNGTDVIAAQPSVVTAWVRQYPRADGFNADASLSFNSTTASTATVQTSTVYSGTTYTSATQSFPMPRRQGGTKVIEQ